MSYFEEKYVMEASNFLHLRTQCPLKAQNAGLFISRGAAMHPTRIIDSHELIFVKQGELDMWEDGQTFHLEAGQTLHLWPGRQHGSTKPMPLGLKFYWIHFEVEDRGGKQERHSSHAFPPAIKVPQVARIGQPERLERLFRTFLDDQETGLLHPYSANLLTMLMLVEVTQAAEEKPNNPEDINVVATWAHTYIRINYDRSITTCKVAEALGYNADYLGRIYRQVYGCTLTEAIHRRRIHVACQYLLDSNLTVEQIAHKCGFSDPDYFRRIFRRHMQISPGDYRNEYSHLHVNTH
jgi:AraC-like DNA-binding protein